MRQETGFLLRLIGPLIEIVCVLLWIKYRGQGIRYAGVPLETLLFIGVGVGLAMVILGLLASRKRGSARGKYSRTGADDGHEPFDAP